MRGVNPIYGELFATLVNGLEVRIGYCSEGWEGAMTQEHGRYPIERIRWSPEAQPESVDGLHFQNRQALETSLREFMADVDQDIAHDPEEWGFDSLKEEE